MARNKHRGRRPSRGGRPLGPWDRTPAGIRAAIISTPILLGLFIINSIGITLLENQINAGLICYPIQILAYTLNGFIAGSQARSSFNKATRVVGRKGETVRRQHPEYLVQGAIAGILLGIISVIVYFAVGAAAQELIPLVTIFLDFTSASAILFLIVDFTISVGAAVIGSLIYSRVAG